MKKQKAHKKNQGTRAHVTTFPRRIVRCDALQGSLQKYKLLTEQFFTI